MRKEYYIFESTETCHYREQIIVIASHIDEAIGKINHNTFGVSGCNYKCPIPLIERTCKEPNSGYRCLSPEHRYFKDYFVGTKSITNNSIDYLDFVTYARLFETVVTSIDPYKSHEVPVIPQSSIEEYSNNNIIVRRMPLCQT
jgi:hypothetical protein